MAFQNPETPLVRLLVTEAAQPETLFMLRCVAAEELSVCASCVERAFTCHRTMCGSFISPSDERMPLVPSQESILTYSTF